VVGSSRISASSATLVATLAALHRVSKDRWRTDGVDRRYTVYTSTQGHSSIEKAARITGLGDAGMRLIEVDSEILAMSPDALRAAIDADEAAGAVPDKVVATIGTTSTTAIDPVRRIGEVCLEAGLWLHIDAAYAGSAAVCPELRWTHDGVEFADSYCFDPPRAATGRRPFSSARPTPSVYRRASTCDRSSRRMRICTSRWSKPRPLGIQDRPHRR
jgi:aromatic-L-amino-acid decarboxylase